MHAREQPPPDGHRPGHPRRPAARLLIAAAVLAAAGCSLEDIPLDPPDSVDGYQGLCNEDETTRPAVRSPAEYVGAGPHRLVLGTWPAFGGPVVPLEWRAQDPKNARLLACVQPSDDGSILQECSYVVFQGQRPTVIPLRARHYTFVVKELHTLTTVAVVRLDGRSCPERIATTAALLFATVTTEELTAALRDVVTSPVAPRST